MKFLTHQILGMAALPLLALVFVLLFVLTLRARRGSRLYRLRVALLGLIVALWGGGQAGCGDKPHEGEITCYIAVTDWSVDEDSALEPKEEGFIDPFPEPTCYLPMDPRPDAVDDDGDLDALDVSADEDAAEEADGDEDAADDAADDAAADVDGDEVE